MRELLRLARQLRCDSPDPREAFAHRMRIGVVVALFILIAYLLR
ncbi:hypothetical protein [Bosea minatitlanensis]|jgi:hypothetical protein|uniref:Uncharacterized protein n=1 Tax=Bosea minatitlanensis TaxID=128782 RepID=A0ABW0F7W4_9HYPH|nr:hypothetical protein [Bosea minatitlanensis]MCT4494549.1 hypothetical protein [Bosea minatitlanensis]